MGYIYVIYLSGIINVWMKKVVDSNEVWMRSSKTLYHHHHRHRYHHHHHQDHHGHHHHHHHHHHHLYLSLYEELMQKR